MLSVPKGIFFCLKRSSSELYFDLALKNFLVYKQAELFKHGIGVLWQVCLDLFSRAKLQGTSMEGCV